MKINNTCYLCNSTALTSIEKIKGEELLKCNTCSFVFFKRRPTYEELHEHYVNYGGGFICSDITRKRYNELLDKMEAFRKTNKMIDVGCGAGFFLEEAKKRGWEVFGSEFGERSVKRCREKGITMFEGELNPEDFEKESFDVITSFEVVEHINNPIDEFTKFNALLRKGGLLYVTTPNYKYLFKDKPRFKKSVLTYPEHLAFFTPKTIKKLGQITGFKTKKIETTGIVLSDFKKVKEQTFSVKSETKQVETIREQVEGNPILQGIKKLVNMLLSKFGIGESLKAWFVKI